MLSQSEKLEQFFFTQSLKTFYVFPYSKDIPLKNLSDLHHQHFHP